MAKSKKKTSKPVTNWRIPAPTPGDNVNFPDLAEHMGKLLADIARAEIRVVSMRRNRMLTKPEQENILKDIYAHYYRMFGQYFNRLMAMPEYKSGAELDAMDRIDLTDLHLGEEELKDEYQKNLEQYLDNLDNLVYASVPCFKEGVVQVSASRRTYFKVLEVDPDAHIIRIYLRDYMKHSWPEEAGPIDSTWWDIGTGGEYLFAPGHLTYHEQRAGLDLIMSQCKLEEFIDLYTKISPKALGWNAEDVRLWEKLLLQNAVDQYHRFLYRRQKPTVNLLEQFNSFIVTSNLFLSKYKPVLEKTPKETPDEPKDPASQTKKTIVTPSAKRVRTVGTIRFLSEKAPKRATEATVRHWHIASWPTRGHMRTLRSGKQVYVQPSIHHRKALEGKKNKPEVTQSIIRIKDNSGA